MRLRRIRLTNFKRFPDFEAQFGPGINVVKGPLNEMGKSTLLEGIIVALFRDPKSAAKDVKAYAAWGSTGQFRTSLEFEHDGNGYLLEKDFDKGTVRLTGIDSGEEIDTFKSVAERMDELLGTKSDRLFVCSCCIRQSQVAEVSDGRKEIGESLEEVVTGGRERTLASLVIQKLENKVAEMRRGLDRPAKDLGVLAGLRSRVQDAEREYEDVRAEVSGVEAKKVELVDVERQLAGVKEEYEKYRAWLEKNKRRKDVEASLKDLGRKYDEVEELLVGITELMTGLEEASKALRSVAGLEDETQVLDYRNKLNAIQTRRKDIEEDLAVREQEATRAREELDRRKTHRRLGSTKTRAAAALIFTGGVVGTVVGPVYLLGLIVLGAALFVLSMRARNALTQYGASLSDVQTRIHKMREALDELDRTERALLAETGCKAVVEFDSKERDFNHWLKEKRSLEAQLKGMLRGKTMEELQKQKRAIAKDMAVEQEKLTEDLLETRLDAEGYMELERKVRGLEERQMELEGRKRDCLAAIRHARFDAEDQVRLEEKLESLREALEREERKVKIYETTGRYISEARTETLSSANEALEQEIRKYFAVFTDGRYNMVQVDKKDLEFRVYSDEKADWVNPGELSGGVIDEFYLAFRIALARLIFGDRRPPLILDDPFVNFDPVRLAGTLEFFKTLAPEHQIIIFTLSDAYDAVADKTILLPGRDSLF